MSSAPGPLATHDAISRQGPMTNVNICILKLAKSVTVSMQKLQEAVFITTRNLFKLDSTPPLPQRTAAEHCACCIQGSGGSIQFLLTASSCHCQERTLGTAHSAPQALLNFTAHCQHLCPSQILDSSFAEFLEIKHCE